MRNSQLTLGRQPMFFFSDVHLPQVILKPLYATLRNTDHYLDPQGYTIM